MDDLKQIYREALVARIDALEAVKKGLEEKSSDALDSLRRIAHTLKGSGGTYGFAEITAAAAAVEEAEDRDLPDRIDALLDVLKAVAYGGAERKFGLLIIEDDPITSKILQVKLAENNREVFAVETAHEAEEILKNEEIDIILLDLILPDTDGRNFLMKLREKPSMAGLPVFITSAKGSSATQAECFALGADGFFEKPLDNEILSAAVSAKLQRSGEIKRESRSDPLTGLPNRAAFAEDFKRSQSLAQRSRDPLTLAIIDVDHFKNVNDTHGHATGDVVLKRLGKVLTENLRQTDVLARWGGEEFVILFPKAGLEGAAMALQKGLDALGAVKFQGEDGIAFKVTFSGGLAVVSDEMTVDEAVAEADRLLYLAKGNGRNQILSEAIKLDQAAKIILLAEDDELIASVIKHRLGKEGFEVIHFPDGTSALAGAPDVEAVMAILDVKMPGMDGFELLANLREMTYYRKIPIVMLTSMGSEKDIVRGFELGADDYIMKPFSPTELLARVRRLIKA